MVSFCTFLSWLFMLYEILYIFVKLYVSCGSFRPVHDIICLGCGPTIWAVYLAKCCDTCPVCLEQQEEFEKQACC